MGTDQEYSVFSRRVARIGSSLGVEVPSWLAGRLADRVLYVYIDGDSIVFSTEPVLDRYILSIKPRKYTRYRDRLYYALTIPSVFARELGISEGAVLVFEVRDNIIVARKISD